MKNRKNHSIQRGKNQNSGFLGEGVQARGELTGKDLEKTFLSDRTFLWGFGYKTVSLEKALYT